METAISKASPKVKGFMFYVAFAASLGGLLFGFDTAVISGAEEKIQTEYDLTDFWQGFTMAITLIGTIIGALCSSAPSEKYGRVGLLKVIGFIYLISAIGSAAILNWYSFLFFRFIGGLAVGSSSVLGPMYIAEISPAKWRGRFVAFFQFNIVLGIVLAYLSNLLIYGIPNDWRWMLAVMAVPALLFSVMMFTVPESPRWLIKHGRDDEARRSINLTESIDTDAKMNDIRESLADVKVENDRLFQKKYWKPILLAFLIATFNQLSGINAINYYAPRIFGNIYGNEDKMLYALIIGLTNFTFTTLGMVIIDKVGRKKLICIGAVGMTIAQGLVAYGFFNHIQDTPLVLFSLMAFIAFFAMSLGATIWVVISEVFPNSVREKGQVLGSMTHWGWNAILIWSFPLMINNFPAQIFTFFSVMCLISLVYGIKLPETRNKTLEEIQKELTK